MAEFWGHVARENPKVNATEDTLWACDQCSTGWGRTQQPHGCMPESYAECVPGGKRGVCKAYSPCLPLSLPFAMPDLVSLAGLQVSHVGCIIAAGERQGTWEI